MLVCEFAVDLLFGLIAVTLAWDELCASGCRLFFVRFWRSLGFSRLGNGR